MQTSQQITREHGAIQRLIRGTRWPCLPSLQAKVSCYRYHLECGPAPNGKIHSRSGTLRTGWREVRIGQVGNTPLDHYCRSFQLPFRLAKLDGSLAPVDLGIRFTKVIRNGGRFTARSKSGIRGRIERSGRRNGAEKGKSAWYGACNPAKIDGITCGRKPRVVDTLLTLHAEAITVQWPVDVVDDSVPADRIG